MGSAAGVGHRPPVAGAGPAALRRASCRPCPRPPPPSPVPQKGEELADILTLVDTQTPVEQVIAVPKISNDSIQPRLVHCDLRRREIAEQLVEVPTAFSSSRLPSRSLTFLFLVVVMVREVYKVLTQDRVQRRFLEQNIQLMKDFSQDKVQQRRVGQNLMIITIMMIFSQNRAQKLDVELLSVFKAFSLDRVQQQRVEVLKIFLQDMVHQRLVERILSVILPRLSLLGVLPIGHRFLRNASLRGWRGLVPSCHRCPWMKRRRRR